MQYPIKNGIVDIDYMRHTDLDDLIQLAKVSFANEYVARGMTPDSLEKQIRRMARGRMIPFKLTKMVSGRKWEILVAKENGEIVGCTGYAGQNQIELLNLMVDPKQRRRGISQALIKCQLDIIQKEGYPSVTASILANNTASLATSDLQNLKVFDTFTTLSVELPSQVSSDISLTARPVQPEDITLYQKMEKEVTDPKLLDLVGSTQFRYFVTWQNKLRMRLNGGISNRWLFEKDNIPVGFLSVFTNPYQSIGVVARPVVTDPAYIPAMLNVATDWLISVGKTGVHVTLSSSQEGLITQLQEQGWTLEQSWVRVFRRF